jgi:hypothetical protein
MLQDRKRAADEWANLRYGYGLAATDESVKPRDTPRLVTRKIEFAQLLLTASGRVAAQFL